MAVYYTHGNYKVVKEKLEEQVNCLLYFPPGSQKTRRVFEDNMKYLCNNGKGVLDKLEFCASTSTKEEEEEECHRIALIEAIARAICHGSKA